MGGYSNDADDISRYRPEHPDARRLSGIRPNRNEETVELGDE
jgi:hypothetical protein